MIRMSEMMRGNLPMTSQRKKNIVNHFNNYAEERDRWIKKNPEYYRDDREYFKFLVQPGQRVLDLGCGNGDLLAELSPEYGVGIDFSNRFTEIAASRYPHLKFLSGDIESEDFLKTVHGKFDVVILSDTVGFLDDCSETFKKIHRYCTPDTRLIVAYYAWFWEPVFRIGEALGLKSPSVKMNWLSTEDTTAFLQLADFEPVKTEWRQICPKRLLGFGLLANRFLAPMPFIRKLCLRNYLVARPVGKKVDKAPSASIVIPCRNEKGNVENAVKRIPEFCDDIEVIFVEGGSQDGTREEIERVINAYPNKNIKMLVQDGNGKGDAVRKGFDHAAGDVLMILDADLTVPPEDLPKFYHAIASGKAEFVNGTRLVYPMEQQAMRFLNFLANRIFSIIFTWLLNHRYTDTLCGTKVLTKSNYIRIKENRHYFGEFDPFGDFDLIFGATRLNLRVLEVPIRYAARQYGETQISRFRHGWLLLKMVIFAFRKLKIVA